MSLEAALNRNSDLLEKQIALTEKLLGAALSSEENVDESTDDAAEETAEKKVVEKKKPGRPAKDAAKEKTGGAGYEITYPDLKKKLGNWLTEFAKAEDKDAPEGAHPEVSARKVAMKSDVLGKLKIKALAEIENDTAKLTAVNKWFEEKAKVLDHVGAGAGRYAADPEADEDDSSTDDELDL